MGITTPVMYKNMYMGEMSEQQAEMVLKIRNSSNIEGLTNWLFDFPNELIYKSMDEHKSIRQILKDENIDYKPYITKLRTYQTVGTAFMYMSPRSILGDGVGLGKTAEVSALLNYLKSRNELKRFIMAVENSAWAQTTVELIRFTGLRIIQLPSEATKMKKVIKDTDWRTVDGMVIKHSALRSDVFSKWLAGWIDAEGNNLLYDTFILDESSVIKNQKTKTYDYTKNMCDIAKRVHFLNATTFETKIMDIYYQMDMMYPTLLPKKWRIEKEFCTFGQTSYWTKVNGKAQLNFRHELRGYKNQEIFKQSLALNYFGRSKSDIGLDVPHIYKVYEISPSTDQSLALSKGYRYNEVLNCPSLIKELGIPTDRKNVPKLDRLLDLVENDFSNESIMIFAFHIEAQKRIKEELEKLGRHPVILNGDCVDNDRIEAQTGFNNGTYDVIITNIKKSLNLFGGNVCIFYSVLTNPAAMFQAAGRIDRVGRISKEDAESGNFDKYIKTFILLLYKGTDEYKFFTDVVKQRAKDARDLTIDAKTTVDHFIEAMQEQEISNKGV